MFIKYFFNIMLCNKRIFKRKTCKLKTSLDMSSTVEHKLVSMEFETSRALYIIYLY